MKKLNTEGFQGIAFGIMDGVILALGVLTGLSTLENRFILFLGILATGVADAFGNSAGIHVEEEMEKGHERAEIWKSTIFTFFSTLSIFLVLLVPILILPLPIAVIASWILGIISLIFLGCMVAGIMRRNKFMIVAEYVAWGVIASVICLFLGNFAKSLTLV